MQILEVFWQVRKDLPAARQTRQSLPIIPNVPARVAPIFLERGIFSRFLGLALFGANRVRARTINTAAACLSVCLLAVGISGCCTHQAACRECAAKPSQPASAAAQPVPGALEYPRFHPVPTQPVFLPAGLETFPAEVQTAPTQAVPLKAVPSDGR